MGFQLPQPAGSLAGLRKFAKSDSPNPGLRLVTMFVLHSRAQLGEKAPAKAMLLELTDVPHHYVYKAIVYAGLRDKDNCLLYLQMGAPLGIAPDYLKISPLYRFLQGNPRFEEVLQQMGLSGDTKAFF